MPYAIGIISVRGDDYPPTRRFIEAGRAAGHAVSVIHPYRMWPVVGSGSPAVVPSGGPRFDAVMPRQGAEVGDGCLPLVRHFMNTHTLVINGLEAIMCCRNQFLTLQRLNAAGVSVPHTVFVNDVDGLTAACSELEGDQVVVKPVSGRQGKGLALMRRRDAKAALASPILAEGKGLLVQAFISPEGRRDIRVLVVGGKVVGAMALFPLAGDFRANYHLSGHAAPVDVNADLASLAVAAAAAVGLDVAGVDVVITPDGHPLVLEVNYSPGFQGLEAATGIDVAGMIVDYIARRVTQHRNKPHS